MLRKDKPTSAHRSPGRSGGGKAPVFSYYSSRQAPETPAGRLKKEVRKSFRWQLIPSFIAFFAIAGSLVYTSLLDTNPRLKIDDVGSTVLLQNEAVYSEAVQARLKSSVFNRSKLLINTKGIEKDLLEEFPELKTVGITVPLTGRRPIVTIKAVSPRLLLATPSGNYIIDAAGRAVRKSDDPQLAADLNIPVLHDESGLEPQLGKVILSAREAAFIGEVHHQLQAKQVEAESLTLPPLVNELHLRLAGKPYFVKFNLQGDARQQAGTFLATQARLEADRITPAEYVDVRVEEKAFYR